MTTLSEIAEIHDCEHKTAPITPGGGYFAVGTPAMRGNMMNLAEAREIDEQTFRLWTRRSTPRPGDILFAREAPVGPVVRIPESQNIAPGQRTVLLQPDSRKVDGRFLYYLLASPVVQSVITEKSAGSTVHHLNVADVRSLPLGQLAPLTEQRAIGEVLGALDDKIAANRRLVDATRELMTSLVRPERFDHTHPVRLLAVATYLSRGKAPRYVEDGAFVIGQRCVRQGRVLLENARRSEWVKNAMPLELDDVLVNSTGMGSLGRVGRWTLSERAFVDTHITVVRFDPASVNRTFAGEVLCRMEDQIELLAEGSTGQTELRRELLSAVAINLPARGVQDSVGSSIDALTRRRDAAVRENVTLAATRDELLPLLMSGRITVKDAEKTVEGVV